MDDTIAVFTDVRSDEIIAAGGLGDWVLNPERAGTCKYLVCCRKRRWSNVDEGIEPRAAFLVGRIKELKSGLANRRGQRRHFIAITHYARISRPGAWGEWRNPVAYGSLKTFGIKPAGLQFAPVPAAGKRGSRRPPGAPIALTIEEAKRALAKTFGVKPAAIEIIVRYSRQSYPRRPSSRAKASPSCATMR
jgi:hypothetical protein